MKLKVHKIFLLLSVAMLISSCATSKIIDSVVVKRLRVEPRKVFILSYMDFALPRPFRDGYVNGMTKEFSRLGSVVVAAQVTGLELDKSIYTRQMEDMQPDLVLVVQTDMNAVWDTVYSGKILLSLLDYRDETEAWKLLQTFRVDYLTKRGLYKSGAGFARDAFQQLLNDRVFMPGGANKKADKLAQERAWSTVFDAG